LTLDELARSHGSRSDGGKPRGGQLGQRRFDKLDTNHDGVVTLDEYVAAAAARYREFDPTGSGQVTAREIAASPTAHARAERMAERIVARLDTNGDGKVSADEFLAAAKRRFARLDADNDGFIEAGEAGARHRGHAGKRPFDGRGG